MTTRIAYLRSPNTDATLRTTAFLDECEVLRPFCAEVGATLSAVHWRDPAVDWREFAYIIPKNAWDYFDHYREFLQWLDMCAEQGVSLKNHASLIRWNTHKQYLLDMQQRGAAIAPFRMCATADEFGAVRAEFERHPRILLKPAVSGGGKQTKIYTRAEWDMCLRDGLEILHECPVMVQPYLPEIEQGEWSFFFFGGNFSHAIVKIPKAGDFRAHSLFGATNHAATPTGAQIDAARAFLEILPHAPQYARVDGVYVGGQLLLIELELIEPYLYFECAPPQAPRAWAAALLAS